jgi:ElaB/YqjD/DUF883 family membrane-anchored ribosome-binding protein
MNTTSDSLSNVSRENSTADKGKTTRRAADAAHSVIDDTAAKAEVVEQNLRQKAAKASRKVEASQEAAVQKFESSIAKAEAFAKEQPIAAAGIAFAAGVIASALLRR